MEANSFSSKSMTCLMRFTYAEPFPVGEGPGGSTS